jgi:histidinol-phosphate aminotransferase
LSDCERAKSLIMPPFPRPGILKISPYVGGEAKIAGRNRVLRLASNENPLGPSAKAVEAYQALAQELHRYPDGGAEELRRAIAQSVILPAEQLVCGAGSDELISLLVRAYAGPGEEVLYSQYGFLMYPLAALSCGARPVTAPEDRLRADCEALLAQVTDDTRLLFLANPNNPTGSYLSAAELHALHKGLPERVLLVIDAAYAEYVEAEDYSDGADLVAKAENVVMLRTFSKIHGLAALRLGWAYCPPAVADVLHRVRGPFNVSGAAQAAGVAAISDSDHVARSRDMNVKSKKHLSKGLAGLGLTVYPSEGNFLLVRFADENACAAAGAALKEAGILVRQAASYGLADCLRITIGREEDTEELLTALAQHLAAEERSE